MIFVGDIVEDTVHILDADGNPVTGLAPGGITANIYDESNGFFGAAVVAEIGVTGIYYADMPPDAEGTWKMHWSTPTPRTSTIHRFIVRNAQDVIADQVWDELFAGHAAAGSFGKLVQDIFTAIVALNDLSIADVQTALTNQGYTAGRAVLIDNLDWPISTVLAVLAGLNDLSIADVQTALTNQGYTNVRAALLDNLTNLDGAISTVLAAIGALNDLSQADVQAAMTAQGYTAVRAALLDLLDAPISGVPAAVDVLLSAIHGAGSWETADLCDYHAQPC